MHGDEGSALQTVRGAVSDRPWGLTLGALGTGARTALLTLRSGDKVFCIAFERGVAIAASSPLAADSAARVALTSQLITPAQVNEIKVRIAAAPDSDEVDVLAAAAWLSPAQARVLRHRLVAQRAARTFSVDRGQYEIEERAPVPAAPVGVDVRRIIYTGARMNLSELRLGLDLRRLGTRFALKPGAFDAPSRYGFSCIERPVLEALRRGTSLPELEANQRELDPRVAQAVIYALASCDALMPAEPLAAGSGASRPMPAPRAPTPPPTMPPPRAPTPPPVPAPRAPTLRDLGGLALRPPAPPLPWSAPPRAKPRTLPPPCAAPPRARPRTVPPQACAAPPRAKSRTVPPQACAAPRAKSRTVPPRTKPRTVPPHAPAAQARPRSLAVPPPIPSRPPPVPSHPTVAAVRMRIEGGPPRRRSGDEDGSPLPRSMLDTFRTNKTTTVRPNALAVREVIALIEHLSALLDRGADHFTLLGLAIGAPIEDVHAAYVELSRHLQASRLAELGVADEGLAAQRLLAQIGIAFTVLTDRILRPEYIESLQGAAQSNGDRRPSA